MVSIIAKIVAEMGLLLLRQTLVSQVLMYTLDSFAKKSEGKLDDKIVKSVADALGVKLD